VEQVAGPKALVELVAGPQALGRLVAARRLVPAQAGRGSPPQAGAVDTFFPNPQAVAMLLVS